MESLGLSEVLKRLNQEPSLLSQEGGCDSNTNNLSNNHRHATLKQLRELLSNEEEKGIVRALAIDAQVDRLLCWHISCTIPHLACASAEPSSLNLGTSTSNALTTPTIKIDRTALQLTLECLTLLWTKTSTTERRKETRRHGVDLCNGLLLIWQTFPDDEQLIRSIRLILKSWTQLCKDDAAVRHTLIRQCNLVSFLNVHLEQTIHSYNQPTSQQKLAGANCPCPPSGYLGVMKLLVFRAADGSQKEYLYDKWNEVVLRCIPSATNEMNWSDANKVELYECADAATAILWNWASWGPLARTMAKSQNLWGALRALMDESVLQHEGQQMQQFFSIQRHVLSTIGTIISCFSGNKQQELLHQQRIGHTHYDDQENYHDVITAVPDLLQQQAWILNSFRGIIQETVDTDSRRRCLRTIRCLSSCSWGRLYMQTNATATKDKPLMALMLRVLRRPEKDSNVHIQVCQTIVSLAPCLSQDWIRPWIPHLQVALIHKIQEHQTTDKVLAIAALSALSASCLVFENVETAQVLGWNGEEAPSTAFYKQLKYLLASVYKDDVVFHQTVAEFLNHLVLFDSNHQNEIHASVLNVVDMDLVNEPSERERMDEDEPAHAALQVELRPSSPYFFAGNHHVVELFCLLLSPSNPDFERSQQITIESLSLLVRHHDDRNKKALADHDDLLTKIVSLCLVTTINGRSKDEAKRVILALVPEL
ncbi:hypothetical protein ACA910_009675 [Epithemia clementina (nom. ined.)]